MIESLRPAFDEIDSRLAVLTGFREKPAGTVRITTPQQAAESLLWPTIEWLARDYPDVKFELSMESALVNLVTQRFDAAVRLGEQVAKDMIAVRIGPGMCMAAIGAPEMRIRPRFSPWVAATGGLRPMILLVGAIGIEPTKVNQIRKLAKLSLPQATAVGQLWGKGTFQTLSAPLFPRWLKERLPTRIGPSADTLSHADSARNAGESVRPEPSGS